ncbi:MAG: HAMP domain-containing histidine kinase [Parasporobacterium sp.]|nr:HAMP domain-containing histidine kinase [Parasporobacterium sp.]
MKLQTKLTLWFAALLLLVAGALLLALQMVSGSAARNTASTTLKNAVNSFAGELDYDHGQLRISKSGTYDDGAYLQVYSADGSELLAGSDVFSIQSLMPDFLWSHDAGQVFPIDTEEASVYCLIRWLSEDADDHGHSGKKGGAEEPFSVKDGEDGSKPAKSDENGTKSARSDEDRTKSAESDTGEESPKLTRQESEDSGEILNFQNGSSPEDGESGGVWIVGILPRDSMDNLMNSIMRMGYIGLPVILLLAVLGGWAIAGSSLRPLRSITESARKIRDGSDLSRRIEIRDGKDEVHELAETFNSMMSRLERSFNAERQFTSDASHELRTPTTVILAECEMAEKAAGEEEVVQESIREIHKQARKMSELIGKLLSYTRLEQGTRRIDREAVDLSELVEDVCEEQRTVAVRGIQIRSETQPDLMVMGDTSLLISLIQNLVSNAVKYGKDNGHVLVRTYVQGKNACVLVRDDGIGIAREDLDHIWNRFYQTDRSRSDESRGVGLGLSLASQIARLHHGEITVTSTLGEGSEFIFSMPAE